MSSRSPRVAHLTSVHAIDDTRIFFRECRTLAAAGFGVTWIGQCAASHEVSGVRILGVPVARSRLRRMTVTIWDVLIGALRSGARICHFHDPELIPAGLVLKLLGRKVIYDVHEDYPRKMLAKEWIHPIVKRPIAAGVSVLEAVAGRLFDGVVAATPTIAVRFPPTKTIMLRNFPSLEDFPTTSLPLYTERPLQVCYVGRLNRLRGLFDMIDAVGQVRGGAAQCLLIAGVFDYAHDEPESRARPGWRRVGYLGWLDRPAVTRLVSNVRAGLVMLHPDPCYIDAYPIKMFEYMAAGLPVVASDFPVYREILDNGRCGLLIPPADPSALSRAIEWIFGHPDEAQAMGECGRRRVEMLYTWQAEWGKLVTLYRQLAPATPGDDPAKMSNAMAMDAASLPFVSIVMPIRNEFADIGTCLESVLTCDYPTERLELLAVDGMSDDGTRDVVASLAARDPRIRLLDNPERTTPHALNMGIADARGELIVRMDAHAIYPAEYIRRCVTGLLESGADNIGGVLITVPGDETPIAYAIAVALSSPFGVGNAYFRIGTNTPRWVDTVPFGCWRRQLLLSLGGFDTELPRNQDDELNARILKRGGRILLDPEIRARYVARPTLRKLALMLYQYGYYKPFAVHRAGRIASLRQLAPPLLVATLFVAAVAGLAWPGAWLILFGIVVAHLGFGLALGLVGARQHGPAIALRLPLIFAVMHGAYGWGYLRGLFDLLTRGRAPRPAPLSR
jgi:glycosyltransferase involved in cell wall biosynthesis